VTGVLIGNTCVDQIPLIYFIPSNLISFIVMLVAGIALAGLTAYYTKHEKHFLIAMYDRLHWDSFLVPHPARTSYSGACIVAGAVSQLALGDSRMLLIRDILSFPLSGKLLSLLL
jgi:hypothetical protein